MNEMIAIRGELKPAEKSLLDAFADFLLGHARSSLRQIK